MIEKARQQVRRLGSRAEVLGSCPVCGEQVGPRQDPVKAWAGKYAHGECASYVRRDRRAAASSQRIHERFTTA